MEQKIKMDQTNRAKQFAPFAALTGYEETLKAKEASVLNLDDQVIVPVIASFNQKGDMIPLYFSTEGIRLKIDNVKWISKRKAWGLQYRCEITIQDRLEVIDLFYYDTMHLWTMKKKFT